MKDLLYDLGYGKILEDSGVHRPSEIPRPRHHGSTIVGQLEIFYSCSDTFLGKSGYNAVEIAD